MIWTERLFLEYVDALQTAGDDGDFERIAKRASRALGFRWFAYLCIRDGTPKLISSYPKSWTDRYLGLNYQGLDPVILRARAEHNQFDWAVSRSSVPRDKEQRRFLEEAMTFRITSGITVPIRAGFGRMAAFTLASDEASAAPHRLLATSPDMVQLLGFYFHMHLGKQLFGQPDVSKGNPVLSQRERQCLAWAARGKTIAETAVLIGTTPRTVAFHLENARRKLDAASIAHCVAQAMRQGLLP